MENKPKVFIPSQDIHFCFSSDRILSSSLLLNFFSSFLFSVAVEIPDTARYSSILGCII